MRRRVRRGLDIRLGGWTSLPAWAWLGWTALTVAIVCWALSYYRTWTGTAIPAFGPVEPYVAAWQHRLLLHLGLGIAVVPAWLWASYNLWKQRVGRPGREEFPRLHRTSS